MLNLELDFYSPALNYFTRERLDPVLYVLCSLFALEKGGLGYKVLQCITLFFSASWLFKVAGAGRSQCIAAAVSLLVVLIFVGGFDVIVLKAHWYPALLAALLSTSGSGKQRLWVYALATLWAISAGNIAFTGGVASMLSLAVLRQLMSARIESSSEASQNMGVALGIVLLGALLLTPEYKMPDYPTEARLTAISPIQFYEAPLVGTALIPNPVVDSVRLIQIGVVFYKLLLVSSVFLFLQCLVSSRRGTVFSAQFFAVLVGLVLTIAVVSSEYVLERFPFPGLLAEYRSRTIFPLLRRLFPGLSLCELPWVLSSFGVVFVFAIISPLWRPTHYLVLSSVLLMASGLFSANRGTSYENIATLPIKELSVSSVEEKLKLSPSRYLITQVGEWIINRKNTALVRLLRGRDFDVSIDAVPHTEEAVLAVDGVLATRWRTKRPQSSGDKLILRFDREISLARAVLNVGQNTSDFPRGVEVFVMDAGGERRKVLSLADWPGPVKWSRDGFPYFGAQSDVVLDFPSQERITGIEFIQTGSDETFDWSVNEIELYRSG